MAIIHNNEKGFTLVELLVSILIFAIGVAALTQTLLATMRGNNLGNKETTAMTLAYHQIEELRGIDPSKFDSDWRLNPAASTTIIHAPTNNTAASSTATTNVVPQILGGVQVVTAPAGYHVSYTIANITTGNGALFYNAAKQVTVTVSWSDPAAHSVVLSSIITPNL
jgi:type IV pilus assembly protein PilV